MKNSIGFSKYLFAFIKTFLGPVNNCGTYFYMKFYYLKKNGSNEINFFVRTKINNPIV